MRTRHAVRLALLSALLATLLACPGEPEPGSDAGQSDAALGDGGLVGDASFADAAIADTREVDTAIGDVGSTDSAASLDAGDSDAGGAEDAGVLCPLPQGLGVMSCVCDQLDDSEWTSASPFWFDSALDFGTTGWDAAALTTGGQAILEAGNLNVNSLKSEITAYEALARCEAAIFLKGEDEIDYSNPDGKKTDVLVEIDGRKVGVSVTRAVHWPRGDPFTVADAETLLNNKLGDIPLSAANAASGDDAWERSILGVVAYDAQHAEVLETVWSGLDSALKADTILFVTVTDGDDSELY